MKHKEWQAGWDLCVAELNRLYGDLSVVIKRAISEVEANAHVFDYMPPSWRDTVLVDYDINTAIHRLEEWKTKRPSLIDEFGDRIDDIRSVSGSPGFSRPEIGIGTSLDDRLGRIEESVGHLRRQSQKTRQQFASGTKAELVLATLALGGRCPCCDDTVVVLSDGRRAKSAEFDHFFANHIASVESGWLICKGCHGRLTNDATLRRRTSPVFCQFQDAREANSAQRNMLE